jgi:zinc protease
MPDNGLTKTQLSNGMAVIMKEMHHAPVASFWVWYRVGSRNEVPGITGISHWVEHMLFKGTPTFPRGEFDRQIARNGGTFNGFTWIDFTGYFETLPSDRFDLALRIEADRMVNATFDPDETESERTVIISEREGHENQPGFQLAEAVRAAAFQAHPYHHEVIGWKSDLRAITRAELYEHYRRFYSPDNAVAVAVGDFSTAQLQDRLEELFGRLPVGPARPVVKIEEPPQRGERRVIVEGDGTTAYLTMVFHAPPARHPDYFPLVVLDAILGGAKTLALFGGGGSNRSSRLYKALVETELAAHVDSSYLPTLDPFLFSFDVTVRAGRTLAECEAALWREIERAMNEPPTEAELQKAIKQSRAQFAFSAESVTNQAAWLGFSEIVASSEWLHSYLDSLACVTAADVQRVARQYLAQSRRTVGWFVPKG